MIRATTGGVLKTYRYNLMNSFISQNNAMNTVLTQRTFNSYAEDPASAAKAFRLRKSRMTVTSQKAICADTAKKYETAYASLQSMDDVLCTKNGVPGAYMKTLSGTTLSWLNDPEGDAREQLSKVLDQMSELLTQDMNQKYGDNFIFAGADGHNVPFEIRQVNGQNKLYYRGVDVDAAVPNVALNTNGELLEIDPDSNLITGGNTNTAYIKQPITSALIKATDYNDLAPDERPNVLMQVPGKNQFFTAQGEIVDNDTYTGDGTHRQ